MSAAASTGTAAPPEPPGRSLGRRWVRGASSRLRTTGIPVAVGLLTGLAVWWLLSVTETLEFLPTPGAVAEEFGEAVTSSEFYSAMGATLQRIGIGWAIAYTAAIAIGLSMARNWIFEAAAHPYVFIGLAVPAPVTILFAVLALGLGETTSLVALCVVVTPFIVTFIYDGARAIDESYVEMSNVFRFSFRERLRHVIMPQLAPALLSGARFGFAMTWKIVVLVEALSAADGIGERLDYFFAFNQSAAILAWVFSFTLIMFVVEFAVFRTISRRLFRWKRATPGEAGEPAIVA